MAILLNKWEISWNPATYFFFSFYGLMFPVTVAPIVITHAHVTMKMHCTVCSTRSTSINQHVCSRHDFSGPVVLEIMGHTPCALFPDAQEHRTLPRPVRDLLVCSFILVITPQTTKLLIADFHCSSQHPRDIHAAVSEKIGDSKTALQAALFCRGPLMLHVEFMLKYNWQSVDLQGEHKFYLRVQMLPLISFCNLPSYFLDFAFP